MICRFCGTRFGIHPTTIQAPPNCAFGDEDDLKREGEKLWQESFISDEEGECGCRGE